MFAALLFTSVNTAPEIADADVLTQKPEGGTTQRFAEFSKVSICENCFISMPLTGHLNPMTTLARKLQSRGHEIVFIGVPDTAQSAALDWISSPVAKRSSPQGHAPAFSLPLPGSTAWKHGRMSEIQVVLAKGNNIERADLGPIPSNVIVVDKATRFELTQARHALHHPRWAQHRALVARLWCADGHHPGRL